MPITYVPADWCQSAGTATWTPIYNATTTATLTAGSWVYDPWNWTWNTGQNATVATMTTMILTMDERHAQFNALPAPEPFPAPPAPHIPPDVVEHAINRRAALRTDRAAADARAEELLAMLLTTEQLADRAQYGYFEVTGSAGGRYRIYRGVTGNVRQLSTFEINGAVSEVASLCAHPPLEVPRGDVYVAQLLALTTDELAFREVANISALH